jgi:hypothetical protein
MFSCFFLRVRERTILFPEEWSFPDEQSLINTHIVRIVSIFCGRFKTTLACTCLCFDISTCILITKGGEEDVEFDPWHQYLLSTLHCATAVALFLQREHWYGECLVICVLSFSTNTFDTHFNSHTKELSHVTVTFSILRNGNL